MSRMSRYLVIYCPLVSLFITPRTPLTIIVRSRHSMPISDLVIEINIFKSIAIILSHQKYTNKSQKKNIYNKHMASTTAADYDTDPS